MANEKHLIEVVGSGCPTCKKLHQRVLQAAEESNLTDTVTYSSDVTKLISLGVLQSPALVIDGQVVLSGQVPELTEIKSIIQKRLN